MEEIFIVLALYLVLLFGLALWSRKSTHTLKGYFIAGRELPPAVVAFSTNATGQSGWLLLGLTGMGYAVGAQAFWVVLGEVVGISLAWLLVARRFKRLADEADAITVPDVLAWRFQDRRHVLRLLSAGIILLMVGTYVAAQLVAGGKTLSGFTSLDYPAAVLLGAVVIIGYTLVGGYKAVAWTDLIQGLAMWIGLLAIPIAAILAAGGWSAMLDTLAAQDPAYLSPWGSDGTGLKGMVAVLSFLAIGWGFLGMPQLLVRFMSARSEQSLVPAMRISIVVLACFGAGAVLTGMAGRALMPGLEDQEAILPLLAQDLFNPWITGVIMVVVLAAIMSTVDSLLILASSALVRDVLQQARGVAASEQRMARFGKAVTMFIGVLGVIFALHQTPLIFWFVLFSWNGLGAAFGPPVLCALWYRSTTLAGAVAGMLSGFLTTVCWLLFFKESAYNLLEIVPGFLVGLLVTLLVSRFTAPRAQLP